MGFSPRREFLDTKFVGVETGVVFRNYRISQDGLAHLTYGMHAARHNGVAEIRTARVLQRNRDSGD